MGDWSWSDVASEAKPRTDTVPIILDGNLGRQLDDAWAAKRAAAKDDSLAGDAVAEAEAEIARIESEAKKSTKDFTVHSIGYRPWRDLVETHPAKDGGDRWDVATFVPAAILASCEQFTTAAEVEQALNVLSTGQIGKLFAAVRSVNEGDDRLPFERRR